MRPPHGGDLRKGRYSERARVYLVTTVVRGREPVFAQWQIGRELVRVLRTMDQEAHTQTLAFVVMPDHLHWLFALGDAADLSTVVRLVKGRSSRWIGANRGISGFWQKGFHDRAARREEDLVSLARYVVANPLRAGLVERLGDYPLWDSAYL